LRAFSGVPAQRSLKSGSAAQHRPLSRSESDEGRVDEALEVRSAFQQHIAVRSRLLGFRRFTRAGLPRGRLEVASVSALNENFMTTTKMRWPEALNPQERVDRARVIVSRQIDDLQSLIAVSEANRIIIYSPKLASQIPASYAANAFNVFQWVSLNYEIPRACALWDSPREDRASIPTLISLVNTPECRTILEADLGRNTPYAARHKAKFDRAVTLAKRIEASRFTAALYRFRNEQLAHSLVSGRPTAPSTLPKYGYERRILTASIAVAEAFNNAVRDSSFFFEDAIKISKANAEALWNGCTFAVSR